MSKIRQNTFGPPEKEISIATQVARYVSTHPSVRDCLRDGVINLSALSRQVHASMQRKRGISILAVQKSLQRFMRRQKQVSPQNQEQIVKLVTKARIRVKTDMNVVLCKAMDDIGPLQSLQRKITEDRGEFQIIDGDGFCVIITHEDYLPEIQKGLRGRIRSVVERLAELHLIFGEKIEVTPGVVSFVYQRLAERGINIREEMSCWTDIKLLIDERDLSRALEALDFSE